MPARLHKLRRWDVPQRPCAADCLVMAADIILAGIAFPERQVGKIGAVRVNLSPAGEARDYDHRTAAAIDFPACAGRHAKLLSHAFHLGISPATFDLTVSGVVMMSAGFHRWRDRCRKGQSMHFGRRHIISVRRCHRPPLQAAAKPI